jgi:hypothetical protein
MGEEAEGPGATVYEILETIGTDVRPLCAEAPPRVVPLPGALAAWRGQSAFAVCRPPHGPRSRFRSDIVLDAAALFMPACVSGCLRALSADGPPSRTLADDRVAPVSGTVVWPNVGCAAVWHGNNFGISIM